MPKTLYTAHATALGGRNGHTETDNGLKFELATPGAPNAKPGTTNPEQLFASGYSACFGSALEHVAREQKIVVKDAKVQADVNLNQGDEGYFLSVTLNVTLPGLANDQAAKLVEAAHQVCPYSKATRGNIKVTLTANSQSLAQAA